MRAAVRTVRSRPFILLALATLLSLGGCAGQDLEMGPPRDISGSGEMKPGRGLLTGDSGEWVIYRE